MSRGRPKINHTAHEVYEELKKNGWRRDDTSLALGVSTTTVSNYIRKLRHLGYEILDAPKGTKSNVIKCEGVRGMPSNEERLRYLDNPTVRA